MPKYRYRWGGNLLVNTRTGEEKYFYQKNIASAIGSGEWMGRQGDRMSLADSGGGTTEIDASDAEKYFREGYTPEAGSHLRWRTKQDRLEKEYGDGFWNTGRALLEGAARGVTFGGSDVMLQAFGASKEGMRERRVRNPWAAGIGEIGGIVVPSVMSGGTSLLARGATKAAAETAATKAAPSAFKSMMGYTPPVVVMRGTERAVIGVTGGAAATGVIPRAGQMAAALALEGAAYGAGQGLSTVSLAEDPMTAEALWSEMKAGAFHGAVLGAAFGGGLSLLGDGHRAVKIWREGRQAGRMSEADAVLKTITDDALKAEKEAGKNAFIGTEEAKLGARDARKAEAEGLRKVNKAKAEYTTKLKAVDREQRAAEEALEAELAAVKTRADDAAVNLRKKEELLATAEQAVDTAARRLTKASGKTGKRNLEQLKKRKQEELAELKKATKKAEEEVEKVGTELAKKVESVEEQMGRLLADPAGTGAGKLTERMWVMYKNAEKWRQAAWQIRNKFFHKKSHPLTDALEESNIHLNKMMNEFEGLFVTFEKRGKAGQRVNRRIIDITDDRVQMVAREHRDAYTRMIQIMDNLVIASRRQSDELAKLRQATNDFQGMAFKGKPWEFKLKTTDELFQRQHAPGEYLRAVRQAMDLSDGTTTLEKLGLTEIALDVGGTGGASEQLEDIPYAGKLLNTFLYYKSAGRLARHVDGAVSHAGAKPSAQAVSKAADDILSEAGTQAGIKAEIKAIEKQQAIDLVDDIAEDIAVAEGKLSGKQAAVDQAKAAVDDAERALAEAPELGKTAVDAKREVLRRAREERTAAISDTSKIDALEDLRQQLTDARTVSEALVIARKADALGLGGAAGAAGASGRKGMGIFESSIVNGVGQGLYSGAGPGLAGKRTAVSVATGALASGIARRGWRKFRGKGLGASAGEAYVTTTEKIAQKVEGFLGLVEKPGRYAHVGTLSLLDNMSFGFEEEPEEVAARGE